MKSALSSKVKNDELIVLDDLKMEQPKTREMVKVLGNLKVDRKALVVSSTYDENVALSARNIPGVKFVQAEGLNVYDILNHDKLILTRDAVARVEEVWGR